MTSTGSEPHTRQKRVLPSRSRRGGPGVGSCDIDVLILDTQKRKGENEPLIPTETRFLLATNSALVPSSSTSKLSLNVYANERYFDRPEVLKAFREQQTIETPEFTRLSEDAGVGGRFRPRGQEDPSTDTSDAVYEKRHRKYELLEKRQRLREKEQLKHEQYKLKERIDQLRSMDAAAFLALPSSPFTPMSSRQNEQGDDDHATASLPDPHVNGFPTTSNEGERRRKEMLDVALVLEERYRTLLLPKGAGKVKKNSRQGSVVSSVDTESPRIGGRHHDVGESELESDGSTAEEEKERPKLKIKVPPRFSSAHATAAPPSPLHSPRSHSGSLFTDEEDQAKQTDIGHSKSHTPSRKRRKGASFDNDDSPNKTRSSDAVSPLTRKHVSYTSASGTTEWTTSLLLIAAVRRSGEPNARKTQRHVTAFGSKVPPEVEQIRDFVCPEWLNLPAHMSDGTSNSVFTETGPPAHVGGIPKKSTTDTNGLSIRETKKNRVIEADKNIDVP